MNRETQGVPVMIRWIRAHADPDECLADKAASA